MKVKAIAAVGIVAGLVTLAGCASPPPIEFNPQQVSIAREKIDVELRNVAVRTAPEEKQTGNGVNWHHIENGIGDQFLVSSTGTGVPITRQWEVALDSALSESLMFTDNPEQRVSLVVEVKEIDYSGLATVSMEVFANYRLMDRRTGKNLYVQDIRSLGEARAGEAFIGAVRSRIAFVRAVRANIEAFLASLEEQAPQVRQLAQRERVVKTMPTTAVD
ncbi:hypothetical protein BVZ31_07490 [Alcaligenes faecalis]|uniref:hypothetical protein n=1 Tax=Alcaligenes faecalis TaxID=511 RepID=UPI000A2EB3D4|nr:hypothetical protein [Alcaligenes faecalis]OSZ41974.1 hypothetical protein BVZ30_15925 [Alcaligenes faecalis]OSZ50565.1 hypothetical protein BVZ31_07490 [Alcaligenes faecalis]OSZ53249.1 hypothetical protein BVZ32_10885 [Alcaligenes faecalis]